MLYDYCDTIILKMLSVRFEEISVDVRPNRRNKAAFQISPAYCGLYSLDSSFLPVLVHPRFSSIKHRVLETPLVALHSYFPKSVPFFGVTTRTFSCILEFGV